ncbi:MAG: hypothetical protein ABI432_04060 [Flavobacteriales bacterium]
MGTIFMGFTGKGLVAFTGFLIAFAGFDTIFLRGDFAGAFLALFLGVGALFFAAVFLPAIFFGATFFRATAEAFAETFATFLAALAGLPAFTAFFPGFDAGLLRPFGRAFAAVFFLAIRWFSG